MKILFVVQSLVMGGAERLVLDISNELKRRNLAGVLIVAFGKENAYPALSADLNYTVCPVKFNLSVLKKNDIDLSNLLQLINEFRPDIIHTNCYMQEAPPREIVYPAIAYFTHLHFTMPEFASLDPGKIFSKKELSRIFEKRRLFRKYRSARNFFIANSNDIWNYYNKNLTPGLRKRMYLLPNAIDYSKFLNREERNIGPDRPIKLINVGRFHPLKNQRFLVRVIRILKEKGLNISLECVGALNDQEYLMTKEIEEYGLQENIKLTGAVENVEDHLRESDIYVHSALYESFGLVLLEAMASGLPVVCLDAKGNRDILEEGKNGFMIDRPDPDEFAGKIIRLVQDPLLYRSMSVYARDYAGKYDIGPYVDRLLELYTDALNARKISVNSL